MLSQEQIDAMVQKQDGKVIDMPPPKSKDDLIEEALDQGDKASKAKVDALPFTPTDMVAAALSEYERRLPIYIANTERQIRQLVTFGEQRPSIVTGKPGVERTYFHKGVVEDLRKKGFKVIETDVGFDVDLLP